MSDKNEMSHIQVKEQTRKRFDKLVYFPLKLKDRGTTYNDAVNYALDKLEECVAKKGEVVA